MLHEQSINNAFVLMFWERFWRPDNRLGTVPVSWDKLRVSEYPDTATKKWNYILGQTTWWGDVFGKPVWKQPVIISVSSSESEINYTPLKSFSKMSVKLAFIIKYTKHY